MKLSTEQASASALTQRRVCANALDLLGRHKRSPETGALHLDIGCAYHDCVDALRSALGCDYVGVALLSGSVPEFSQAKAEVHAIDLAEEGRVLDALNTIIGQRRVVSISFLVGVDDLGGSIAVLTALGRICRAHGAHLVIGAANVTHRDIGAKLLSGRWDYLPGNLPGSGGAPRYDEHLLASAIKAAALNREFGAPERMTLGTRMLLFVLSIFCDRPNACGPNLGHDVQSRWRERQKQNRKETGKFWYAAIDRAARR
jgi:hypothetical protein